MREALITALSGVVLAALGWFTSWLKSKAKSKVIEAVMAGAAEPLVKLSVPLVVEIGTGSSWGAAH